MHALQKALPKDSILHHYINSRSILETPWSYDVCCGLSTLGALLRRDAYYDQIKWKVFPNISTLLIGPSGVGKNTAINGAESILQQFEMRFIGGKTIESITDMFCKSGDPAVGVYLAKELSDIVGKKDYQQGILQGLTDLLDTNDFKDITIKSDQIVRRIKHPTCTIFAGSTAAWLHKALPAESMSGGFFPRFLITCETHPKRHVPLVADLPQDELAFAQREDGYFLESVKKYKDSWINTGSLGLTDQAKRLYTQWYEKRLSIFSAMAADYGHRARDHALRIALICACSRGHKYIDEEDVFFGITVMNHIALSVDHALAPPSIEAEICKRVLAMLPANEPAIIYEMAKQYPLRNIKDALTLLRESHQITQHEQYVNVNQNRISKEN